MKKKVLFLIAIFLVITATAYAESFSSIKRNQVCQKVIDAKFEVDPEFNIPFGSKLVGKPIEITRMKTTTILEIGPDGTGGTMNKRPIEKIVIQVLSRDGVEYIAFLYLKVNGNELKRLYAQMTNNLIPPLILREELICTGIVDAQGIAHVVVSTCETKLKALIKSALPNPSPKFPLIKT